MQPTSIKKILCPTDFSDFSDRALARAMGLARWFGAAVTTLHSIPFASPHVPAPGEKKTEPPAVFLSERRSEAERHVKSLTSTFATEGVSLSSLLVEGEPWMAIASAAREMPADLIVMGTHGTSGWSRFLMGSTTEQVIRRVHCPVLTVGPRDDMSDGLLFRRILCAVDLGESSQATLEAALNIAEQDDALITLLHALPAPREEWAPLPLLAAHNETFKATLQQDALAELDRLGRGHDRCSLKMSAVFGTPWREIVRTAIDEGSDLIVVGAQGAGGFGPLFVGSTASQVMRHAPCPVLVVRTQPSLPRA